MRLLTAAFAVLMAGLACSGAAAAAAEGKRVMLLGTANTVPTIIHTLMASVQSARVL